MYLTDMLRPFAFPHFVRNFSSCSYLHDIHILVLTHNNDAHVYHEQLKDTKINYRIAQVEQEKNYLRKIAVTLQYMSDNQIPYLMKHDNDIVMSGHLYDYLYKNLECLQDEKNLVLTPTLTSGIPTCDIFLEDFCSEQEKDTMGRLFLRYTHGPLWGTDYTELNSHTVGAASWNARAYYAAVKERTHHYKGIHPVRMEKDAIITLNQYVLEKKDKIFAKGDYTLSYDSESPYFCNSIFCIRADIYQKILQRQDLYVDSFDEVPLNKWRDMFQLNLVIVRNGVAIHPIYNTIENYLSLEKDFFDKL